MNTFEILKKQALVIAASIVLVLIVLNTIIVQHNKKVLRETNQIHEDTKDALYQTSQLWDQVVRNADIGLRGYALTKMDGLLGPTKDAIRDFKPTMERLRTITTKQGFKHTGAIDSIEYCVANFLNVCLEMAELARIDSMAQFHAMLKKDPGKDTWMIFSRNSTLVKDFENELSKAATLRYEKVNDRTAFFQTLLIIIGAPTLVFLIFKIIKDQKDRATLFLKLEKNNRTFLFNPGSALDIKNEDAIIENSIHNFQKATQFITEVSQGNYQVEWSGINEANKELNQNNLAGELIRMRNRMKAIKTEDEIRSWTTEGLAKYSDVIRQHQQNLEGLSREALAFLTKYLGAQQGAIFILKEEHQSNPYLEMTASYALSKKRIGNKKIEVGQGLIGQAFIEGQTVLLTEIPKNYTEITSCVGEKSPDSLLIVPMKYNEKTEAVIEIAGFSIFEKYKIEFMEKVGEITASTIGSVKNTEKIKQLLDRSQIQTELLKTKEEELIRHLEKIEASHKSLQKGKETKISPPNSEV